MTDTGRVLTDQALAVPAKPASGLDPSGVDPSRALLEQVGNGIPECIRLIQEAEAEGDVFWSRYWAGYLRCFQHLRDAIAAGSDSAAPKGIAQ